MIKIEYKGFTAELVSIRKEYSGVIFTKVPEEYKSISKEYCGGLHRTLQEKLIDMVDLIDYLIISKEEQKRKTMKNFNVEYKGYVLEVEINKEYSYIKGVCESISFENSGHISVTLSPITALFIETVDLLTESKKEKDFEYKGYTLKLGVVETRKGGYCEELNYKTYGDDEEANITKFKKYINWKITSTKKEDKSHTHLLTQLDRLAKKDKDNNFTPFELRGQLIEIYHLFGKILSLTAQDINKLYFERAEG